jgi:putative pyruvate formate lyase activating enzyme
LAALAECTLCARQCGAGRFDAGNVAPFCRTGRLAEVASYFAHHGEEACLRGWNGSGTIFFSHCNLRCVFCQNYDISWQGGGQPVSAEELAHIMLDLQEQCCHNINFVTPSHVVAQILEAVAVAAGKGLTIPLVYNTGGYDRVETLRLLDGVIDIYMPDFKFWDARVAGELAHAADYREVACQAVAEMHRQVGDLELDSRGLARRGLLVRHLVMPDGQAGTRDVMRFLAGLSRDTYVNIMGQYRPEFHAREHPAIARPVTLAELHEACRIARDEGLWRFNRG